MSEGSTPHFRKRTLQLGEVFTHNPAGRALAWLATAPSPQLLSIYRQLVWTSRFTEPESTLTAREIEGDPRARGPARFWGRAAIVGASMHDLEITLLSTWPDEANIYPGRAHEGRVEAVAYRSEGTTYVGYHPRHEPLFRPVPTARDESPRNGADTDLTSVAGVAFRKGQGPLNCTIGYAVLGEGAFYGAEFPDVHESDTALRDLKTDYPGVLLVG